MASTPTPPPSPRPQLLGDFSITHPALNESIRLNTDDTIHVVVDDTQGHDSVVATVYSLADHLPDAPAPGICASLTLTGNTWAGNIQAGYLDSYDILENHKQIAVYGIKAGVPTLLDNPFRINRGGTASLTCSTTAAQTVCSNCAATLPVCVQMTLAGLNNDVDDRCKECANLNGTTPLQHSNDPFFCCCWFSDAINCCASNNAPGYWKLQKTDATTWNLTLYLSHANAPPTAVAVYSATTAAGNVCTFPMTLNFVSRPDATACDGFPGTITISVS